MRKRGFYPRLALRSLRLNGKFYLPYLLSILPEQVPADGPGQYFAVERYYLEKGRLTAIKEKHINVLLKLNCYRQLTLDGDLFKVTLTFPAAE